MDHAQRTRRQQEVRTILAQVAIPVGIRPETAAELRGLVEQNYVRSVKGLADMPGEEDIKRWLGSLKGRRPDLFQPPNSALTGRQMMELGRGLHPAVNDSLT